MLAVFGWRLENRSLECRFCQRKIQLSEDISYELSVLEGHRYFCKWGNVDDPEFLKKTYGWRICLDLLFEQYLGGKDKPKKY